MCFKKEQQQIKRSRNWRTGISTNTPEHKEQSHDQSKNKTLQNLEIKKIKAYNLDSM